jgi:DNA helicase-2/ATP-dependent DNA helicase PcrA
VIGNFKRANSAVGLKVDPASFKPSPSDSIQAGMKVLHMKFGEGKVVSVDGGANNRVATIHFEEIDNPERRIMLRFAKLQIL